MSISMKSSKTQMYSEIERLRTLTDQLTPNNFVHRTMTSRYCVTKYTRSRHYAKHV